MSATARALILDFGGIITRTPFETHRMTEQALGLQPRSLTWMGPFDPQSDPLWRQMQLGAISERDYWLTRTREVGRLVNEDGNDMATFIRRARGANPEQVIRPEATAAVEAVKAAGFMAAVLSNELDLFYGEQFRQRLSVMRLFDVVVDATHTRVLKPDPRAYRVVLDAIACAPADGVFVDDQKRNIDGAGAAGMRTVHFDVCAPAASFAEALAHFGLSLSLPRSQSCATQIS